MIDTFNLIDGGGVLLPAAIAANAAITSPYASMNGVDYIDIVIRLENGAGEPVVTLQQAQDGSGTGVKALPISNIRIAANADVDAVQPWVQDESVNRTTPSTTYTPAGAYVTAALEALVHVRVHVGDLDDGFTHVRVLTPAITARAAIIAIVACDKNYKGPMANPLVG